MKRRPLGLLAAVVSLLALLAIGILFHTELPRSYLLISLFIVAFAGIATTLLSHFFLSENHQFQSTSSSKLSKIEDELWLMKIAVDKSQGAFYIHSAEGEVLYVNDFACNSLGYSRGELIGMYPWQFDPDFLAEAWPPLWQTLKQNGNILIESRHRHKDGTVFPVEISGHFLMHNNTDFSFVFVQNISNRKRTTEALVKSEAQLRQRERYQRALLDNFPFEVWLKDKESRFLAVNQAFAQAFGFDDANQLIGKNDFDASPQDLAEIYRADDKDVMATRQKKMVEEEIEDQGVRKWVETYKAPVLDENNEILGTVGFARDITARKDAEKQMRFLAHFDQLTSLPNRTLLIDRTNQAIAKAKRKKCMLAVLFLDLDRFKPVNDKYGHGIGDLLLKAVAERLLECARRETDTVSRPGGDEFVILLSHIDEIDEASTIAEKILQAVRQSFLTENHTINISASIGIGIYPQHGENVEEILKNSDAAMYQAKKNGHDCYQFYQTG